MSDTARFVAFLAERRSEGLHSHETRRLGVSGNPSQRAKDAVSKGTPVFTAREAVGRRPGSRYWLAPYAPDFAIPVQPNRSSETDAPREQSDSSDAGPSGSESPGENPALAGGQLFDVPAPGPTSAVTGKAA